MASPTIAVEPALAAPPAVVVGMQVFGVSIPDLVVLLNLIYILLMLGFFVYNRVKEFRGRK